MITWAQKGKIAVLLDGQMGSTGKGQIAAWLAINACPDGIDIGTTNAGANAGHTTRWKDNHFVCFSLPTIPVMFNLMGHATPLAYVNAGSIVDPDALAAELAQVGFPADRLAIHPRAAVITAENRALEHVAGSSTERLASTQKGVGAAIADKVMRRSKLAGGTPSLEKFCRKIDLNAMLRDGAIVSCEVPQGFGLSLNHGYQYPYVTSRDCYLNSALSDSGGHPHFLGKVCMTVRTYPIRVGAIENELGETLGTSGPFPSDCVELDWARDLPGIEPERTTVTKRVRRIATWSNELYREALSFNRPDIVALTFCDYLNTHDDLEALLEEMIAIEADLGLYSVNKIFSWGNRVEDVGTHEEAREWLKRRGPVR